jgi:hypothetical protein
MRRQPHAGLRAPSKLLIATMSWSTCATRSKARWADQPESLPEVEAERGEPCSSSQPSTGSPQPSHLPDAIRQEDEPAGTPPDQGASALGTRTLTEASQRRQISRANRLVRYEQIVALHQKGLSQRRIARHLHVSRKLVRRSLTAGAFPERAPTGRRETQTRVPTFPICANVGRRAVTTACNSRANCKPKDFADPPRWSVGSLAIGEHACLGHQSGCAARNDRQFHPPSAVCHPGMRPGCSSQTSSSSRQTSGRSSSASASPMPPSRNSTS